MEDMEVCYRMAEQWACVVYRTKVPGVSGDRMRTRMTDALH